MEKLVLAKFALDMAHFYISTRQGDFAIQCLSEADRLIDELQTTEHEALSASDDNPVS